MTYLINFGVARHFAYRGCADLFKRTTKFRVYPHMLIHVAKSTNYLIFQKSSTMAKERSTDKDAADSKREKHPKSKKEKEKRSEKDGVHKSSKSSSSKKVKPEKIKAKAAATTAEDRKEEGEEDLTTTLLDTLNEDKKKPSSSIIASAIAKEKEKDTEENGSSSVTVKIKPTPPLLGALVPFAHPLADEKIQKKVFKIIKKGLFCSNPVPLIYIKQKAQFPLPNCHYPFTLHMIISC